jgi:hypothetical protein
MYLDRAVGYLTSDKRNVPPFLGYHKKENISHISASSKNMSFPSIIFTSDYHILFFYSVGLDSGASDSRAKRISSFLFHPFFPLVLSIQQTYMQPTVVNIHFRR